MVDDNRQVEQPACPLSIGQQNRNLVRYGIHTSLIYLAAPVVYVGSMHAVLLNKVGCSDKIANLPAAAYMWTLAPAAILATWYFCQVRMLKPVLVTAYATSASAGLMVVVGLLQPRSEWLVAVIVAHAMLVGACASLINVFEWEILSRGVAEQRRGWALSLAFGIGPVLAVLSSLATQLVLDGSLGPIALGRFPFPWDFALLFAGSGLAMAIPAISGLFYVVPRPATEIAREPLIAGVFGGLGDFLKNRLLMLTTIGFLLMLFSADSILPTVVLYTREALGSEPQAYAGYQFTLRFAFKIVAGLFLGWMLTRTHPRFGLLATTSLCLAGLTWALCVPGKWYLVSYGILGAGELYYVYYQNYLISCSPLSRVRRNLAYANLLSLLVSLGPVFYGLISDRWGLRCSIEMAMLVLIATLFLVQLTLPRRPETPASE
jgi:hypothetical protein